MVCGEGGVQCSRSLPQWGQSKPKGTTQKKKIYWEKNHERNIINGARS